MATTSKEFFDLAGEAREGNADAAMELARRAPNKGFLSFLAAWVPPEQMTTLAFDTLADGWHRAAMEREAKASAD